MPRNLSDSSSEEEQNADIVQLFASEDEVLETPQTDRPNTRSAVAPSGSIGGTTNNGPGKGPGKNKKVKGPTKRVNVSNKRKQDDVPVPKKQRKVDFNPSQIYFMLSELLKRSITQSSTDEPEACTSAINTESVEEIFPFSDDLNGMDKSDLFSIDNDPEVIFDDESFQCPRFLKTRQNFVLQCRKIWQSSLKWAALRKQM